MIAGATNDATRAWPRVACPRCRAEVLKRPPAAGGGPPRLYDRLSGWPALLVLWPHECPKHRRSERSEP